MGRPKKALLSRDIIARAAIELVESGVELQVVPLAEALGVSQSSLYHHVSGREGIVHAIRDVLASDYQPPSLEGLAWDEQVRTLVRALGDLYADHPRVLQLLLTVTVDAPASLEVYGQLADALSAGGVPDDELLTTVETLDAFAFGVALDTLSPESIFAKGALGDHLDALIEAHPTGKARNQRLFERGLELILAGVRAQFGSA